MGVNIKEEFLQKEEWIDAVKYMSPRPRYNHIELQGEMYLQVMFLTFSESMYMQPPR